jgi:Immunoglobulin domain
MNEKSVHVLERTHIEIECIIEASPRPVSYWIKEPLSRSLYQSSENPRQNVLQGGDKYAITESLQSHYKTTMRMKISNFSESDVGVYTCIASNVMGRANSTIRLYGECWPFHCSRFFFQRKGIKAFNGNDHW